MSKLVESVPIKLIVTLVFLCVNPAFTFDGAAKTAPILERRVRLGLTN